MIIHNMPDDFRLTRVYAFSEMPGARYFAERAISIDSKGLACLLNDVGVGYAVAATAVYNVGAAPGVPRALAYRLPADSGFFERGEGWHKVDFLAMPVRFHPSVTPAQWQLLSYTDEGWAAAGFVHFQKSGHGFLVPAGQALDFTSQESLSASAADGHLLPPHIGAREMVVGSVLPEIRDIAGMYQSRELSRERMAV